MAFALLHLSDLHFDSAETAEVQQARRVVALGGLLCTLSDLIAAEPDLRPSAICISGDIAYRSLRSEYDAAEVWIRELLRRTGVAASELVLAPGNHDIDRNTATKIDRPTNHREADQLLGVPANATLTAAFIEYEAFCERLGVKRLQVGARESYLVGSRTIDGIRFVVLNSAWLARDDHDTTQLWLGYPQLLVLEARDQMCSVDRDFSTVEVAVFHHPQEYLAEPERYAVENRPATFTHVAARVDLILTGHSHVQDSREPDHIGMRAYHFAGGAVFVDNEYHNHVRIFLIDSSARTVQVVALSYDPINQRWSVASDRPTYDLMTRQKVERIRMSVREAQPVEDKGADVATTDPESGWHQLVDQARDLLRAGKSAAARAILLDIRGKADASGFSDKLRFRIATNLGGAAIDLDDFQTAVSELKDASALERTADSVSNVALALLGSGDVDGALQSASEALELDPKSDAATFVHLKALAAAGRYAEIVKIASSVDQTTASFAFALALADVSLARQDYAAGESWSRLAVKMNPSHPFANMLLAENIVAAINSSSDREPSQLSADVKRQLDDAESAVTVALTVFGSDDHSSRRNVALNVRAGIAALRGSFEECIQYTDQVLSHDPSNEIARQNRGLALYQLDRYHEAVAMLTSIRDPAIQALVALPLADSYLKLNQPTKANEALAPHFHPERSDEQQLQTAELLLDSATRRNAPSEIDELVRVIDEHWPNDPIASAIIASKEFAAGRHKEAIQRVQAALNTATGSVRSKLALHLGRMYHDIRQYSLAIRYFESSTDTVTAETPSVDRYVHALFRTGRFDDALKMARAMRGGRDSAGKVTEIEADILAQQGDVAAAALLFENLVRAEPNEVAHRTRLASLYARLGRRDEARSLVEAITLESIKNEPVRLFEVAKLRLLLEMPEVIRFAFFGRRSDFHSADAHSEYIYLFKGRDVRDDASLSVDTIGPGTTAYLDGPNGLRVVSVFDESEPLQGPDELHPSMPLAARLLGRRAGDQVVIKQTALEEQIVTIREVVSNYVWALRQSAENFTTWFPDDPSIQMAGNDPGSLERLARHMRKQNDNFAELVHAYEKRKMSVPLFAIYAGMRPADVWRRLWNDPDILVRVHTGAASVSLNESDTIVVELTALLSLGFLDVLDVVQKRFRLVVAQLTLDEISEEVLQIGIEELSANKVANAAGNPDKLAELAEARERREFFKRLRTFVETKTERRVSSSVLAASPAEIAKRERLQGRSGHHSTRIAKEYSLPVIIDDFKVREIAISEQLPVASSLDVLQELRRSAILTDEQLGQAIEKLKSACYDIAVE